MLNPSTADATEDDPTIRRCIAFSKAWGAGGIKVANLFAYRATNPSVLRDVPDPIGERCDDFIIYASCHALFTVAAWGTNGLYKCRDSAVRQMFWREMGDLYCLGTNADGTPKHPLYLPKTATPELFLGQESNE